MSRIRTIKPDFWTSEQIIECSPNARLLFIGLWNFCDDAGRHSWSPRQIRAQVFPGDHFTTDEVSRMLDELSTNDLIRRYAVDGKEYLYVTGWHHQKIDRPQKPTCPAPLDEHSTNARDGREGKGEEGNGREDAAQHVAEERAGAEPPPPEPGRKADLDRIEASCREAAGLETDPSPSLLDLSPIVALIDAGYRLESDILPKLREAKARGKRGSSWRYYVVGITEAKAANRGIPVKPETVVSPTVWITTDDPRWPDACAEAKRRIGKEPKPMGSRHEAGVGHHFPAEVVAALAAADAPDRGTFRRMG